MSEFVVEVVVGTNQIIQPNQHEKEHEAEDAVPSEIPAKQEGLVLEQPNPLEEPAPKQEDSTPPEDPKPKEATTGEVNAEEVKADETKKLEAPKEADNSTIEATGGNALVAAEGHEQEQKV